MILHDLYGENRTILHLLLMIKYAPDLNLSLHGFTVMQLHRLMARPEGFAIVLIEVMSDVLIFQSSFHNWNIVRFIFALLPVSVMEIISYLEVDFDVLQSLSFLHHGKNISRKLPESHHIRRCYETFIRWVFAGSLDVSCNNQDFYSYFFQSPFPFFK